MSGPSTPPSVAATTVSSSTGTRLPSAGSFPLPPISEATTSSPSPAGFTASDIVRLVADSVAAATALPARVPSSFKLLPFNGSDGKWVAFNSSLTQPLEMDCFAPGSDDLVTIP